MEIYEEYNTKLSYTDVSTLLLMDYYNIGSLVSFDKEFKTIKILN